MSKKLKTGLAVTLFSSFLGTANAETFTVKDVFVHVIGNGCIKEVNSNVSFGDTKNLKVDECNKKSGGYLLRMTGKLWANFDSSNVNHVQIFTSSFSHEAGVSLQKMADQRMCQITTMPKGATCKIVWNDAIGMATVYDGMDSVTITYAQK